MYRVSNGIVPAIEISDDEAREAYIRTDPRLRTGTLEQGFEVYPQGEFGRVLTCAATFYRPIRGES